MTRTFGTLEHVASQQVHASWRITAEPHVMIRLKRIFPRVKHLRTGEIAIIDTPEIARDLTWVLERWPLKISDTDAEHLAGRDGQYRERTAAVDAILGGYQPPLDLSDLPRPPREYQLVADALFATTKHLLLADDVGLGKTYTSLLRLRDPATLPALVVTLTHLPEQWLDELNKSLPWLRGHIIKSTRPYDPGPADVLITNYHKLAGWSSHLAGTVRTVLFDEAQELRRSGSQKYDAAALVAFQAEYVCGLTATPIYNYGGEIWNVMNVVAPDALGSRDEFGREWGLSGSVDKIKVHDPAALGLYLRELGVLLRRERSDPNVRRELPPVDRVPHTVAIDDAAIKALTDDAVALARTILAPAPGTTRTEQWQAAGDFDWRLRHATGVAKAPYVAEFVRLILEADEPVLLFGWHRDVYSIWEQRLAEHRPAFFTGSESPTQKRRSTEAFLGGDTNLLIMSLRAGAGLDGLQKRSRIAVFGELDWSPGVHEQCVGRLNRDGQDDPVTAYFLIADDGSDPVIAEVLNVKRQQSEPMRNPHAQLFEEATINQDRVKVLAADFLRRRGLTAEG